MSVTAIDRIARATPPRVARKIHGFSDRAIAWIFIAPTIALLLAVNIFPLLWTIYLSFTNYRANRPNADVEWLAGIGRDDGATLDHNVEHECLRLQFR
jgi:multiple sugar transport system permease protein